MKFGIGQPMRRHEDLRLITGRGRYTDDVILPRMTHAFVLRSPVGHAHIKRIDTAAARRMPGVLFVATGEDVRADGSAMCPAGLVTSYKQLVSDQLGVDADRVDVLMGDTDRTPSGLTGGSRALAVAGATLYEAGRFARTSIDQV